MNHKKTIRVFTLLLSLGIYLSLGVPTLALGPVVFNKHVVGSNFDGAYKVRAADLDNDGDTDIAGVALFGDRVSWWENDGAESFSEHVLNSNFNNANSILIADINLDGDLDIVATGGSPNDLTWWENDGAQGFSEHTIDPAGDGAAGAFAVDLDADGDIDIVSSGGPSSEMAWWKNDGAESFSKQPVATGLTGIRSVYAADLDQDGHMDILSAATALDTIHWWKNDGSQNFSPTVLDNTLDEPNEITVLDMNGDGELDFTSSADVGSEVAWFENDGSENFTKHTIATGFSVARAAYPVDLDADGDFDVIAAAAIGDDIAWWENDGSQNFTQHTIDGNFNEASGTHAADVDGDGDIDVLGAAVLADEIAWWERQGSPPIDYDGFGNFVDSGQFLPANRSNSVALGDLNGDGHIDAFVGNVQGGNRVYLNEGNGALHATSQDLGSSHTYHVVLGDLDGDLDLDAVTANFSNPGQANRIWINDGFGTFAAGQSLGSSASLGADLADLNGDGSLDIVFANYYNQPNTIWTNGGTGNFSSTAVTVGLGHSWDISIGDVDGNGYLDVFVANEHAADPSLPLGNELWLGSAGLSFSNSGQSLGSDNSTDASLGDVNADGYLDVVVANFLLEPNTVWLNDGYGNLVDSGQQLGASHTHEVALGDLDGDGDLDIFAANGGGGTNVNYIWINTGFGRFQRTAQGLGNLSSQQVALADLDGDNDLDGVVANDSTPNKVWLNESLEMPPRCVQTVFSDDFEDGDITAAPYWDAENTAFSQPNGELHSDGLNLDSSGRFGNGFHAPLTDTIKTEDYLELSYTGRLKEPGDPQAGRGMNLRLVSRIPSPSESYNLDIQNGYTNGFPTDKTSISLNIGTSLTLIDVIVWDIAPDYNTYYDVKAIRQYGVWSLYVNDALMGTAADPLNLVEFDEAVINTVGSIIVDDVVIRTGCTSHEPVEIDAGGPYSGNEGAVIAIDGADLIDLDAAHTVSLLWTAGAAPCTFSDPTTLNPTLTCLDDGTYPITLTVQSTPTVATSTAQSLLFMDDFSGSGLDPTLWAFDTNGNGSYLLDAGHLLVNSGTVSGGGGWVETLLQWSDKLYDGSADMLSLEVRWVTSTPNGGSAGFVAPGNAGHAFIGGDLPTLGLKTSFKAYDPDPVITSNLSTQDFDLFHIYRVEAEVDQTRFYYDGDLVQTVAAGIQPDNPMGVRFDRVSRGPNDVLKIDWVKLHAFVKSSGPETTISVATVNVLNVDPVVTLTGPATVDEGETLGYSFTTADPGEETFALDLASCGGGALSSLVFNPVDGSGSFDCTFADGPDSQVISVQVSDGDSGDGSDMLNVTVLNVAPVVTLTGPVLANESETKSYTFTTTDPGQETFALDASSCGNGALSGLAFNPVDGSGSFDCTFADGPDSPEVSAQVSDGDGGQDSDTLNVTVLNVAPMVTLTGSVLANESDTKSYTFTTTDLGQETFALDASSCGNGALSGLAFNPVDGSGSFDCTFADGPDSINVSIQVSDGDGGQDSDNLSVSVQNVAPTIDVLTVPLAPVDIDDQGSFSVDVTFSDPAGALDSPYTCDFDMDNDGSVDSTVVVGVTTCSSPLAYTEPGVYTVKVTVTDKDGGSDMTTAIDFIVVYDPTGGFVTGGGWIWSEAGWCYLDAVCAGAEGKANFGFVSKYKKGASVPTGNTEFNFSAGGLNFHSSAYDWLVINQGGSNAQYKGEGTINGQNSPTGDPYKFMIWATDDNPDTFRIKIWYEDGGADVLVYDTGVKQAIGGGQIKIHDGK